ncbi:MAG: DUF1573 domain-containing protein [Patescibacteria group bacterium]
MNKKWLFAILILGVLIAANFIFKPFSPKVIVNSITTTEDAQKIEITPTFIDIGKVAFAGGIVSKEYEIKNNTDKSLVVRKIVTSCMCTKAAIEVSGKQTNYYAMEMGGDKNPRITFEIPAGKTAKLIAKFDPAAHGLKGVGKVDRSIWITFADPVGVKEVKFAGEVVTSQ